MKKNHSISTVKKRAREQLLGNLSVCVKASIITLFVFLTLVMIVVPAVHTGFFGVALYELSMTLVQLFMGLFISGSAPADPACHRPCLRLSPSSTGFHGICEPPV